MRSDRWANARREKVAPKSGFRPFPPCRAAGTPSRIVTCAKRSFPGGRHWPPLARAVGRPEWLDDPRFATPQARFEHRRELIAALDAIFATKTLEAWSEIFATEPEFFWSPVNTVDDLLGDEQFHASGGLVEVPDDDGTMTMLATPAEFHGTPSVPRR